MILNYVILCDMISLTLKNHVILCEIEFAVMLYVHLYIYIYIVASSGIFK